MSTLTRRSAVASLTAPLVLSSSTAFGSQANSAIAVGMIGTGNRGGYLTEIVAKDSRVRISALCDISPNHLDTVKTKVPQTASARTFKDHADLLASADIDAVVIATPIFLHPSHFEHAVDAKKHIYCEKAAGASVKGVKQLVAAAQRADKSKHIQFGFQQRHSPEYLAAEEVVRTGKLGELLLMRSHWVVGGAPLTATAFTAHDKITDWYSWKEMCGDIIVEQDCHGIDVLNWFAKAHPLSASGKGGRKKRVDGDVMDHLSVVYEYPNGLRGFLHATQFCVNFGQVAEQFLGSEGYLETTRNYYRWHKSKTEVVQAKSKGDITVRALSDFVDRIVAGKPDNEAFFAAESTFTGLLGRLAIEKNREVTWEEMMESA